MMHYLESHHFLDAAHAKKFAEEVGPIDLQIFVIMHVEPRW